MSMSRRALSFCLAAVLVSPALPGTALAGDRTIRCESRNGRYRFCPVDTQDEVRLERQLSNTPCDLWRTWGFDRRGVWVDDGCRGEFKVGKGMSGGKKAAIVGGVAAAAVVAAIIASKSGDKSQHRAEVPDWAVGSFRGYDERERVSYELNVAPNGAVNGWANDDEFNGRWENDRLQVRNRTWRASRDGDDLLLTDDRNARRQVKLWRTW